MTQTHEYVEDDDDRCKTCRLPFDNQRHGGWQTYEVTWTQHEVYTATITARSPEDALRKHQRDHVEEGHWLEPVSTEWSDPTVTLTTD